MNPWSFLSLCLAYLWIVVLGQENFNPLPLNQRQREPSGVVLPRSLTGRSMREAFIRARENVVIKRGIASRRRPAGAARPSAASRRHQHFLASNVRARNLENMQEPYEEATKILNTDFNLSPEQVVATLSEVDLSSILDSNQVQACSAQYNDTNCRARDRYRSFDGTCNNLEHISWGRAGCCFQRLVPPDYADGISQKRVARSGRPLPAPRTVSLEIHAHMDNPTDYVTHMFMQWGQFLDHDISLSPLARENNEVLTCCPPVVNGSAECDPIILQAGDPFFGQFGITCLENSRTLMCLTCTYGPRQQTNQLTAYIDGSHIYGLNTNQSRGLRNLDGTGTLRFVNNPRAGELLPGSFAPNNDECSFQDPNRDCFETGDPRGNQHPALTSLHIIFLREHNRIARRLREINANWDDERLFQEARRIIGAELQMITYSEFLPLVIGPERMEWFDVTVRRRSYTQYDNTVQANLANEFSTAAFRFGHSLINSFFPEISSGANTGNRLRDIFLFPFGLYDGQLEGIVGGMAQSASQKFDRYMVRDVTNHLYQNRGNETGFDLASLNVNRGRDHGIPGYTTLVEFCGGPRITSFRQLDRHFRRGLRPLFERLYETVEDIDLFSGGLAERPNQGAVVGPTFTCINGIQFYHLKYGDRFYFEHGGQAGSFTLDQLIELRKVTLAKLICENSDIEQIQPTVMLFQSARNRAVSCEDIPGMDLTAWRE